MVDLLKDLYSNHIPKQFMVDPCEAPQLVSRQKPSPALRDVENARPG
jgi:hypothetical protein